ncbi:hypothetical protein M0R72_02395 [Candidatus Pacearchaeota archaeon]|jgi:hypothetical protein|nr:hypothetical protein [Candidatus Pacearchaeota archaeon]
MADEIIDLEKIEAVLEKLGSGIQEKLQPYIEKLKEAHLTTLNLSDVTKVLGDDVSKALTTALDSIKGYASIFGGFVKEAEEATNTVKNFVSDSINSMDQIMKKHGLVGTDVAIAFEPAIGLIDKSITGMGKLGDAGYEAGSKISTGFSAVKPLLERVFDGSGAAMKMFSAMSEGASNAVGLQRELLGVSIAQGRAADVTDTASNSFKNMREAYRNNTIAAFETARATGQTVGAVMDLERSVKLIPNAWGDKENLVKISQLATAGMREETEVGKQLSVMYTRLGTSIEDSIKNLAYIQDQGRNSKLQMESFNDTVMTIAGSFKMLGDNTAATTNFVKSFDTAFRDSNISPEAMKQVIVGIGEGVQKMDVAKRAFISGTTGGPGGLAGAIQMDYAIQEGHADQVVRKTMLAMQSQFGGQVVTLKDAAQNPALAGELYKQVQYLTQVAGIAKDDKEAYRVLEAMKSGVTDILKPGAGEDEKGNALTRQLGMGRTEQEKTNTTLMRIHQTMEATKLRQDDIYQVMLIQDPTIMKKVEKMASNMGINVDSLTKTQAEQASSSYNVLGTTDRQAEQENKTWSHARMYGSLNPTEGVGKMLTTAGGSIGTAMHRLTKNESQDLGSSANVPLTTGAHREGQYNIQPMHRPPPGHEAGISTVAHGVKPNLGIPDLPPLQLPTAKGSGDDVATGDLPPLNITHSFEPIQIDITGLGDKKLTRFVDARVESLRSEERGGAAHGGLR